MTNKLTIKQAVIISAYTGYLVCDFSDMHEEVEKRMKRPVFTHEFASEDTNKEIKEMFKKDFIDLCPNKPGGE